MNPRTTSRRSALRLSSALAVAGILAASATCASLALASPGEVSFTPTGLRLSVMRITLSAADDAGNPTNQQVLYACSRPTEEECLVDVTSQSELDALTAASSAAKVDVGTYDTVTLDMCAPGKGGDTRAPGFVRGTFTVGGKSYATVSDPANVTGIVEVEGGTELDGGADSGAEFMAIGTWSCGQKTVRLAVPMTVTTAVVTPLTVVMDAQLIAFSTAFVSPGMGGCRGAANGQSRGVCVSYPSIFPLVGELNPSLDRFLISHHRTDAAAIDDSLANAYVVVAREKARGTPVTAFVRPYYSETSAAATTSGVRDPIRSGPGYFGETLVSTFHVNSDGSVAFVTGGSLDPAAAMFSAFAVHDHVGVVDTRDAGSWNYHAIPVAADAP
jgi:hypothetical protein